MDKILLVLPSLNLGTADIQEPDLGYAHGIISYLVQISSITVLLPWDVETRKYEDYLNRDFGAHVLVRSLTELDRIPNRPPDLRRLFSLPFLDRSIRIHEYILESDYDSVIFDVFEAPGFIPIRAKRTGLGLEKTALVSWLRSCHEFHRHQILETPQDIWLENHLNFAERYCCENCDLVIPHTDTILQWCLDQKWNINLNRIITLDDIKSGAPLHRPGKGMSFGDSNPNHGVQQLEANPLVSICVAHFNDGRNLSYLLKSIHESDYENFEVIVVDDGSTDTESLQIIESLASEYVPESWRFIMKEENESIGPTRNLAVNLARGEFVIFMDSDNLATKTMISDFVRGMLKSGADCLTCSMIKFQGDGGVPDRARLIGQWMPLGACLELGFIDNIIGDANFCVKKSVFTALGGFCGIRGHVADDWEFLSRLILAGFDLDVIPKGLFYYRVRPGSWLQSAWSKHSIQTLRHRFLANTGPQHLLLLHNLLLQTVAENERFRSSVWKLDRKVVKIALKLSDLINEERRLLLQDILIRFLKRINGPYSYVAKFIREKINIFGGVFNTVRRLGSETSRGVLTLREGKPHISRSFVRVVSDSDRVARLIRWGLPSNSPIFGHIGTLALEKGPLGFVKLAYWMQMFEDKSFFVMVGDGIFQDEVKTTAIKYKLNNFKWFPNIENLEEFFPILSGLVITSASEKQGPPEMFEALACGVPVFSTDVGQAKHVLTKYGNGLVIKHDPERKDFADCFKVWKDNLEVYRTAALESAELIGRNFAI
jgi:glycosyltransferase involved in cell wall biosynthesis